MFSELGALSKANQKQLGLLRKHLNSLQSVCVAYSGGVDSSLVAAIAYEQLGEKAIAITGISSALAKHLREEARIQAIWIGIHHEECNTNELADPMYNQNPRIDVLPAKENCIFI